MRCGACGDGVSRRCWLLDAWCSVLRFREDTPADGPSTSNCAFILSHVYRLPHSSPRFTYSPLPCVLCTTTRPLLPLPSGPVNSSDRSSALLISAASLLHCASVFRCPSARTWIRIDYSNTGQSLLPASAAAHERRHPRFSSPASPECTPPRPAPRLPASAQSARGPSLFPVLRAFLRPPAPTTVARRRARLCCDDDGRGCAPLYLPPSRPCVRCT